MAVRGTTNYHFTFLMYVTIAIMQVDHILVKMTHLYVYSFSRKVPTYTFIQSYIFIIKKCPAYTFIRNRGLFGTLEYPTLVDFFSFMFSLKKPIQN